MKFSQIIDCQWMKVMKDMTITPAMTQRSWQQAELACFSCMRSGTSEKAMLRNPPAVKGRTRTRVFSRRELFPNMRATRAPRRPSRAELSWALAASTLQ